MFGPQTSLLFASQSGCQAKPNRNRDVQTDPETYHSADPEDQRGKDYPRLRDH